MKKKAADSFEQELHEEMKAHGLLFPITQEEIEKFEAKFTAVPLPDKLKNAKQILLRNKERIDTTVSPVLQVAALFDTTDVPLKTTSNGRKKKNSKKKGTKRK